MTSLESTQQPPAKAPSPPIPALPGRPGAPTSTAPAADVVQGAQSAADAARQAAQEAQRAADEARQGGGQAGQPVIADAPLPPSFPGSDFPRIDPAEILDKATPIVGMSLAMMIVLFIGWPLSRAFARRQERKIELGAGTIRELQPQIRQLQESIDTMAIELERISESQRFQAKLLAERSVAEAPKRS